MVLLFNGCGQAKTPKEARSAIKKDLRKRLFPSRVEIISKGYFSLEKATEKRAKSFGKIEAKEYVDDGDNELGTL